MNTSDAHLAAAISEALELVEACSGYLEALSSHGPSASAWDRLVADAALYAASEELARRLAVR